MDATLNVTTRISAFTDATTSSNPRLKAVDWTRDVSGVAVTDPKTDLLTIPANSSVTVFSGIRSTTIDGTTAFTLSYSTIDPSRYRITYTGGTAPGWRTARNLTLTGGTVTVVVNLNATATFTVAGGSGTFAAVQTGDEVFIPGPTTGDATTVFNSINEGRWLVLAKSGNTTVTLQRPSGTTFQAWAESVTLTSNTQLRAYATSGVQIGDSVDITGGFSLQTRRTFEVIAITDTWFEFVSTMPLAAESGITPGGAMSFYTDTKRFMYIESDQELVVQCNGDTGNYQRISPADPSDSTAVGQYMRRGPTWALTLVNLTTSPANVLVVHCE